jgi:hypothetical protein
MLFRAKEPSAQWLADVMNQLALEFIVQIADREQLVVLDQQKEIARWEDDGGFR